MDQLRARRPHSCSNSKCVDSSDFSAVIVRVCKRLSRAQVEKYGQNNVLIKSMRGTYSAALTYLKGLGEVDRKVSKSKKGVESAGEDRGNWKVKRMRNSRKRRRAKENYQEYGGERYSRTTLEWV